MEDPKFTYGDKVSFQVDGKKVSGEVYIVDAYGTFFQTEEPSYDIMCEVDGKKCLFKHICQSAVSKEE